MAEGIMDMRIVYMGTPELSSWTLEGLIESGFNIVGVVANEDKPSGRKHTLLPPPTKEVALKYGIPVFQPHRIRNDYGFLKEISPDLIITFAYGQIVPQGVLDLPRLGCLNLHGSLLPEYRGAAPIQRAIMDGKEETGVTLMKMALAMDAGPMLAKKAFPIDQEDNYTTLQRKISEAATFLCLNYLDSYVRGELKEEAQDESLVTFAAKINPEDEHLPLNLSVRETIDYIRGLSDEPGAYLLLKGQKFKIFKARAYEGKWSHEVGTLFRDGKHLLLQLEGGAIEIISLQISGKKRMDGLSFLNGGSAYLGEMLS